MASVQAQSAVPVHEEPRHHLVLERADLRVMDVQIPPGDTTLFHRHASPIHYVQLGVSRTRAQVLGSPWPPVRAPARPLPAPGRGWSNVEYQDKPVRHRVTNTGTGLFRLIAVTNRGAGAPVGERESSGVGVEATNRWFRRRRVQLAPEEFMDWASSVNPRVLIQVTAGEVELSTDNAPTSSVVADWALLRSGVAHRTTNRGVVAVTVVVVSVR